MLFMFSILVFDFPCWKYAFMFFIITWWLFFCCTFCRFNFVIMLVYLMLWDQTHTGQFALNSLQKNWYGFCSFSNHFVRFSFRFFYAHSYSFIFILLDEHTHIMYTTHRQTRVCRVQLIIFLVFSYYPPLEEIAQFSESYLH